MSTQLERESIVGNTIERRRTIVRGIVQGVGFRPFVARLAGELHLSGYCGNDDSSVFIEVEGPTWALDEFDRRLHAESPPLAVVVDVVREARPPEGDRVFEISASRRTAAARTLVSPDVAMCTDCSREFGDPDDRRYRHPFINCTNCGPRLTVITDLPYDRPATTMAAFEMCERCAREYSDPADRRFHAQPISCHDCGPHVVALSAGRRITGDDNVLAEVHGALGAGLVVAVKGIGGFHLVCDATNTGAVARLRERKNRPHKPFAVMAADVAGVEQICHLDAAETAALNSSAGPIVLLRKRSGRTIAASAAPGLDELGIMLAYSGVHKLLLSPVAGRPAARYLVMTSGNLSGEPLCFDNDDAVARLSGVADLFLLHDREIAVPCEDSVLAVADGSVLPIRRSRGFAPVPIVLPDTGPVVLAVGAEVKNTFCLTRQNYAFCSSHLGDMGTLESQRAFELSVDQLMTLHSVTPKLLVADDHPGYATRQWAERHSDTTGIPLTTVQHHHAHVASLLAEHGRIGTAVLGIAFDGTGFGCDRTVWGGELLLVGPNVEDAIRVGHLQSFLLPGGDAAVRNPVRTALALLHEVGIDAPGATATLDPAERKLVASQLASGTGCIRTTSIGRLFDGVSSLLGVCHRVSYEAQAAIELETLARSAHNAIPLHMAIEGDELRLGGLLRELLDGLRSGLAPADLALGFHLALASAAAELAADLARRSQVSTIGLTGGVFGNRILLRVMRTTLQDRGFEVLCHEKVPCNDGGLSIGQAVVGRARYARIDETE
ncbi:carbamoyltransferase HypF [Antrihabitans stalagmiti]|uniref:carbamoyltransferase HypF n=1 Tax=Antrihabitans stalagmiti TaxID=2799499 RepID=UPI0027DD0347|nr:carbamoyltransferase HypF [Antrihabitans stalagmiti]